MALAADSPGDAAISPIAVTARRLASLDPFAGFEVAPAPESRWGGLAEAELDATLDSWLALLNRRHQVRATAGSLLGEALIRTVVLPTVASMVMDLRCPDPSAGNLAARLDDAGEFERAAVLRPSVAVLATDPAANDVHSIVVEDLIGWWAQRAATTLTRLLGAVRARAPFGLPALWGAVADEVTSIALWVGQLSGREPAGVWAYTQQLLDALAPFAPVRMVRPRPFPVEHPAGGRWFRARATCCLSYRSVLAEGPSAERFCSTCPLRDNESRHRYLFDYLSDLAAANTVP